MMHHLGIRHHDVKLGKAEIMDTSSIPGLELIQIADVVAREKSIDREEVIIAMEEAIQKAGRSKYGNDRDIRAMIVR